MWNPPTKKQLEALPAMYSTEETPLEDKKIVMHFFLAGCDWYVAEYDQQTRCFWGFVILNGDLECAEWGQFSLDELLDIKASFMHVDRDLHWRVRPAKEVESIVKAQRWQIKQGSID